MQIVIEIEEEVYKECVPYKDTPIISNLANHNPEITHAIANGIPLPKSHGRLIDADAVEKEMNKSEVEADRNADYYTADKIDCAMEYIINADTIIEAD